MNENHVNDKRQVRRSIPLGCCNAKLSRQRRIVIVISHELIQILCFSCTPEQEGFGNHLKHLAERLLQQDIPDQEGISGSLYYNLTCMKVANAKLPRASLYQGTLLAKHGALSITGKYSFTYNKIIRHSGEGDFDLQISELSIIIKGTTRHRFPSSHADPDSDTIMWYIRHGIVECKIERMKARFHGGSARLCQLISRFFGRMLRNQLENQVAIFIRNMFEEEEEKSILAFMGLFALNGGSGEEDAVEHRGVRRSFNRLMIRIRGQER